MSTRGTKSREVTIRGVTYPDPSAAAAGIGVARSTLYRAIRENKLDTVGLGTGSINICPVLIRGVYYPTQTAAAEALGVRADTISKALTRGNIDSVGIGKGNWLREVDAPRNPITILGVTFPSMAAASRLLGYTDRHVHRVLNTGGKKAKARLMTDIMAYRDAQMTARMDAMRAREGRAQTSHQRMPGAA
jgi:hypothetical protein